MTTSSNLIIINSRDRTSGTPNEFVFNLSENLEEATYQLSSFCMTNNLYNVVAGENDKLYVAHSVDGSNTLTLTPGNYSGSTLATEIKTQLDTISAVVYTVAYSAITNKFTITPDSGNFGFEFSSNTTATSRFLLGKDAVDDVLASSQVSDNPIDLKLHDHILIKIQQDNNQHGTSPNGTEFGALIPIQNDMSFTNIIQYKHGSEFGQFFKFGSSISTLNISLFAEDGGLLPNNKSEWSMSIKKVF